MPPRRRRVIDWSTIVIVTLVLFSATVVFFRDGTDVLYALFIGDLDLFFDMMPKVFAGSLIGAFITLMLPRELVTRFVGAESGFSGILVAAAFGVILPGGPFTIYPIAAAFLAIGADAGAAIAFITSWTLLGYNRALIWEMPFFGFDFVAWRVFAAIPLPIIVGVLGRYAGKLIAARARAS